MYVQFLIDRKGQQQNMSRKHLLRSTRVFQFMDDKYKTITIHILKTARNYDHFPKAQQTHSPPNKTAFTKYYYYYS